MKRAAYAALEWPDPLNLGLPAYMTWLGRGDLQLCSLSGMLATKLASSQAPAVLVIHCGSNDVATHKKHEVLVSLDELGTDLQVMFPLTTIIWSEILPRFEWKGALSYGQRVKEQ